MHQETPTSIFAEIDLTIKAIGEAQLLEVLKIYRSTKTNITLENLNLTNEILKIVCDEFEIKVEDLFYSQKKTISKKYVIGLCVFFLENNVGLSNNDISIILKKPQSNLSVYKKNIVCLKEKFPEDRKIIEKFNKINEKLKNIKNEPRSN